MRILITPHPQTPDLLWPEHLFSSSRTKFGPPWPVFGSSVTKQSHIQNWERSCHGYLRPRTTWRSTSKKHPAALEGKKPRSSERRWLQLMCQGSWRFRGPLVWGRKGGSRFHWWWSYSCPFPKSWKQNLKGIIPGWQCLVQAWKAYRGAGRRSGSGGRISITGYNQTTLQTPYSRQKGSCTFWPLLMSPSLSPATLLLLSINPWPPQGSSTHQVLNSSQL